MCKRGHEGDVVVDPRTSCHLLRTLSEGEGVRARDSKVVGTERGNREAHDRILFSNVCVCVCVSQSPPSETLVLSQGSAANLWWVRSALCSCECVHGHWVEAHRPAGTGWESETWKQRDRSRLPLHRVRGRRVLPSSVLSL